eukprot:15239537-Alexandrium_andersonii.AAC.1
MGSSILLGAATGLVKTPCPQLRRASKRQAGRRRVLEGRGRARAPSRRKAFSPPGVPTFPPPGVPGRSPGKIRASRPVRPRARDGFATG